MTGKKTGRRPIMKRCSACGALFLYAGSHAARNKNFFCCHSCYISFKTMRVPVACDWCGMRFMKKRSDIDKTQHNFCSPECCLAYRHKAGEHAWNHRVDGIVLHRKVAEEMMGRQLLPNEEVHHIDGDHFNNAPDNLEILSKSEHSRIHASRKERNQYGQFVRQITAP